MPSLRFGYIAYPLWRRRMPGWVRPLAAPLLSRFYPVEADRHPPVTAGAMAQFLARWNLLGAAPVPALVRALEESRAHIERTRDLAPPAAPSGKIRIPAQWEPTETVIVSWATLHPPLWPMHARMVEACSLVADVEINVTTPMWAHAIWVYLHERGRANLERVRFLYLPVDDMWVRDYGPVVGLDAAGEQVAVDAIFDPLPNYPKARDNAMPRRWAAHHEIPTCKLELHTEGGNLWSDGQGTLIMSEQVFFSNPYLRRDQLLALLHEVLDFEKLIITPRLDFEETGHVDLLVKLADAQTVLIPRPAGWLNHANLRAAQALFRRETNARSQPYQVIELPHLPPYLNWGVFPIWRTYTNALTVNGCVLVPVYNVPEDDTALRIYQQAMPGYSVIPVDSAVGINGGGAVHCMTKEVPRSQSVQRPIG